MINYFFRASCVPNHLLLLQNSREDLCVSYTSKHGHILVDSVPVHATQGEYVATISNILQEPNIIFRES